MNKKTMATADLATINATAARCAAEGVGLTAWQLRQLVNSGELRSIQRGNRRLIFWPTLQEFLRDGPQQRPRFGPGSRGGVRR